MRLAVVVSHPIPHFAPWYREVHRQGALDLQVFYCCDWGVTAQHDPHFGVRFQWDVPLLDGYHHTFLPIARQPERIGFWQIDNPGVDDALETFSPDVVQVYGYARRTNWRVVSWCRRRHVPVLLYSDSNASARRNRLKAFAKRLVVQYYYDQVDGALFVGDNNQAYHRRFGLPADRLYPGVLPVDVATLTGAVVDRDRTRAELRQQLGVPDDAFVTVFCGKYVPRKRPTDLVRALAGLRERGPYWAVLVGEGPERQALEGLCRELALRTVVLTGFVNQSKIPAYFAAADALAMTSSGDPHPLVVTEAMAFGLPIIASAALGCVGPNDTARPGVNTLVYPTGDVERLAGAIEALHRDPAMAARFGAASRTIAAGQTPDVAARLLTDAVQRLYRSGRRRHRPSDRTLEPHHPS